MHYQKYHKQINHKGEYSVAAEEGESNLRFKAMRKKNVTILLPALVPATCKPFRNLPLDQLKKNLRQTEIVTAEILAQMINNTALNNQDITLHKMYSIQTPPMQYKLYSCLSTNMPFSDSTN